MHGVITMYLLFPLICLFSPQNNDPFVFVKEYIKHTISKFLKNSVRDFEHVGGKILNI